MFRLGLRRLALFFRQLASMMSAGIPLRRALGTLQRSARGRMGRLLVRMSAALEGGESFAQATERCGAAFPPLSRHLIRVGEETGHLDVVLLRLAEFYEMQARLSRRLMSRLVLPLLQYVAAVGVIALATYLGKMMANVNPFGISLPPELILVLGWGLVPAVVIGYKLFTRFVGGGRAFHELALRTPLLGRLLRAFALGRFSWCMSLCGSAGMGAYEAVGLSLTATGNGAFAAKASSVQDSIRGGSSLHEALRRAGLFPLEFLDIVDVAEQSGALTERLEHVSRQYFEDAERGGEALASAVGWGIWVLIACFMIVMIFRVASVAFGGAMRAMDGL